MPGLLLKNITKSFGDTVVLRDISLDLPEGELLVLLGPSGCGKSTLLRLIAGLEQPDKGEIFIGNRRVDHLRPKDRDVALVFQNYSLYPHMTVAKNLAFPLSVAGISRVEKRLRVREAAEMLGLADKLNERPAHLSGGQRQRVALGRAIIRKPSLFLFDEPLSNLDADLRVRMRQEIVRLQKELNTTAIHVTHDQAEALTMGDRIALLHDGRIVQVGTPEELYHSPANLFVASFIGHPKINIIRGKIERRLLIPFGLAMLNEQIPDGPVLVGIRPEEIRITPDGEYVATVSATEYIGGEYIVTLLFKGARLVVANQQTQLTQGATVNFSFPREGLLFFDAGTYVCIS
ncbi:MAG: ABC transporter ATP-binding protein [Candidatus Zixiibacteriota bacterium]